MPHIIVEHSDTLSVNISKLLTALHDTLSKQPTIDIKAIKTRAIPVQHCLVAGWNDPDKMIHVTLKLMPGRDADLRKQMAQALHDVTTHEAKDEEICVTVEVMELDAASYTK